MPYTQHTVPCFVGRDGQGGQNIQVGARVVLHVDILHSMKAMSAEHGKGHCEPLVCPLADEGVRLCLQDDIHHLLVENVEVVFVERAVEFQHEKTALGIRSLEEDRARRQHWRGGGHGGEGVVMVVVVDFVGNVHVYATGQMMWRSGLM